MSGSRAGAMRDVLRGMPHNRDLDFTVERDAVKQSARALAAALKRSMVVAEDPSEALG